MLLTGGAGFIGSHIAQRLADDLARDIRVSARVEVALARCEPARASLMGGLQCDRSKRLGYYR